MKKLFVSCLMIAGLYGLVLCGSGVVFADSGSGAGGSANTDVGCDTATKYTTNVCKDKLGGASWHIFKTMEPNQVYTKYDLYKDSNGPRYCNSISGYDSDNCNRLNALRSGGYDRKLATNCPKAKYDYYVAYVIDGWNGRKNGKKQNVPTYYGPLGWGVKLDGKYSFEHNTNSAMSWGTLEVKLRNSQDITSGQKISDDSAKQLCKADTGEGPCKTVTKLSIPNGTGYMCVSYPHDVTLTAYARDVNGNVLNSGNSISSQTISVPPKGSGSASVSIVAIPGYVFRGWREVESTSGDYVSTGSTLTKTISVNTDVYAYYEKDEVVVDFLEESSLEVKVANNNVNKYSELQTGTIYAKPGDELRFETSYHSGAQKGAEQESNKIIIDGGAQKPDGNSEVKTLRQLFNDYSGALGQWSNGFVVTSDGFISQYREIHSFEVGREVDGIDKNVHVVSGNEVGDLKEIASTLMNESGLGTTPYKVTITSGGGVKLGTINTGLSKEVIVKVPYNFTINASIGTSGESTDPSSSTDGGGNSGGTNPTGGSGNDDAFYAGEEKTLRALIEVGDRPNSLTTNSPDERYSTKADNVSKQVIVYNPDRVGQRDGGVMNGGRSAGGCGYYGVGEDGVNCQTTNLGEIDSLQGGEKNATQVSISVPDVPAGTNMCVALAVFPADSGAEDNTSKDNYTQAWRVSDSKCFKVAKRPSIQVLGGNVYSNGAITTGLSIKKQLSGFGSSNDPYIFGSWGELGVISNGPVSGFASGATLGYGPNHGPLGGYHGKYEFCKLSPLSFANSNCSSGTVGNIGTSSALNGINADRTTLQNFVSKFSGNDTKAEYNNGDLVAISDEATTYYYSNGELSISSGNIPAAAVKVVHAKGNISINGDITYRNDGYTKLDQTPKLVIYSEKNITINCTVNRIDAVLLANTVKTCNSDDINSGANSNQLVINGAILANKLIANRTYGAASGINSIVPAEVIDFDPTLYIWNSLINTSTEEGSHSEGSQQYQSNGELDEVYVHELAPLF